MLEDKKILSHTHTHTQEWNYYFWTNFPRKNPTWEKWCKNEGFYYYVVVRNYEYNLDTKIWLYCRENTSKNTRGKFTLTLGNSGSWMALKSKPSNWACVCSVSLWSCLLLLMPELISRLAILPTIGWGNSSLALWDSFLASGTEAVFPSHQFELPFEASALGLRNLLEKLWHLCKCTRWIWKTSSSLTVRAPH